jgi:transposase
MNCYVGLDVGLDQTSVCVLNAEGEPLNEVSVTSDPEQIGASLLAAGHSYVRVALEAGGLAEWICAGLIGAGLPAICIEARHAHRVLGARANKTDRNDARGIAEIARVGLYRVVHIKTEASSRLRALLAARRLLQIKAIDLENGIGGILRVYGLKVRKVAAANFEQQIRTLAGDHRIIDFVEPLLRARATLRGEFERLDRELEDTASADPICRRLMTAPGVGPLVALTYRAVIDEPARFKRSRDVGAHVGMTPRGAQSGQMQWRGRITKWGDQALRAALFNAAHSILHPRTRPDVLKSWGLGAG